MVKYIGTATALLLLCGCSGEPGDPAEQMRQFCEHWTQIECELADRCGSSAAPCNASCDDPAWQRSFERLEQGRVRFDALAAAQCLQIMRSNADTVFDGCRL